MKGKTKGSAKGILTYEEVYAVLHCRRTWLQRLIARGDLKRALTGRRLGGNGHRQVGVTRESVETYLRWHKVGGIGPPQTTPTRGKPDRAKPAGGGAGELAVRNAPSGALVRISVGDFIIEVRRADGNGS